MSDWRSADRAAARQGPEPLPSAAPTPVSASEDADTCEVTLTFEDNRSASVVLGQYDQNLAKLERALGVVGHANGNHVTLKGETGACEQARRVLELLYLRAASGHEITLGDVAGAVQVSRLQGSLFPEELSAGQRAFEQLSTRKRATVRARNAAQHAYLQAMRSHELVFAEGPAGTGKTWLAVGYAVSLLEQGKVERLILSRPALEAGERLGFLPGDLREKVDPYLRPLYDALFETMGDQCTRLMESGVIEVAPLAFMRGRTLARAFVILDEAQNCTSGQVKMFLTRLGEDSRMVVTGDPSQSDLPGGAAEGLNEALSILGDVEGVATARFGEKDVV